MKYIRRPASSRLPTIHGPTGQRGSTSWAPQRPVEKGRVTPAKVQGRARSKRRLSSRRATGRPPVIAGAAKIEVDGFYGDTDRTIERLRGLARRLDERSDGESASTVREVIATVRRSACLPGSLEAFSRFLVEETTSAMAADLLAQYRVGAAVTALNDARNSASQADAETAATADATATMKSLQRATPMASMLDDAIKPALRSSSKTLIVFRSDMIAEFAQSEMVPRHPKLGERIEDDMIRMGGDRALSALDGIPTSARNQFKRAILVAPTRPSILALFAEAWLPDMIVILADSDTLAFAAKDAVRLAAELPEGPIAMRLSAFAKAAEKRVSEIGRHAVQLDNLAPPEDVEYSTGNVLDLTGGRSDRRLQITMHNGQRIIARQSTEIVLRNSGAATTAFIQVAASKVRLGDEVCCDRAGIRRAGANDRQRARQSGRGNQRVPRAGAEALRPDRWRHRRGEAAQRRSRDGRTQGVARYRALLG